MPKKYTDIQLSSIAHGVVAGLGPNDMAQSADLTVARVNRVISGELPKHELAVYETHLSRAKSRLALARVRHQSEMDTLVQPAYDAISHVVRDFANNPALAVQEAHKILEWAGHIEPKTTAAPGSINAQFNFQNVEPKGVEAIDTLIESVAKTTSQEMETPLPPIGTPSRHITVSQAETIVGEYETPAPEPEPDSAPDEAGE